MHRSIRCCLVALLAVFCSNTAHANDKCPFTFKAGDLVTADMFNELCNAQAPDLATTLIGTWATQCWHGDVASASVPSTGTLTIKSSTDISYTGVSCLAGTGTNPLPSSIVIQSITALGNDGFFVETLSNPQSQSTNKLIRFVIGVEENRITLTTTNPAVEILTRLDTTPTPPTALQASTSGLSVTLTWTDNSSDETEFVILRRDSLLGLFTQIATVSTNVTTYTDTPGTGTYWYRVKAKNANGTSLGSNIVKITVSP